MDPFRKNLRARVLWTLALAVGAWVLTVPPASAYIDGGSASIIFQALIGFAMAAGVAVRVFWSRIRGLFRRQEAEVETTVDADPS